jgi:hypothetical protein
MRILLLFFYLGSILLDAFLSCSGPKTPTPTNTMKFSVDGLAYDGSVNARASQSSDSIDVSSYVPQYAPSPSLNVHLKFPKAVGTYSLTTPGAGTVVYETSSQNIIERYYAGTKASSVFGSGTITVDSYAGGTVTGTFSFTAQHHSSSAIKTITGGSYSTQVL